MTSRGGSTRIAGWIVTGLVTLFLAFDSITHLVREKHVVDFNSRIGAPGWFPVVCGTVLAVCLVAFHVPRTRVLGAILLTGYLGGATAVNLVMGQPAFNTAFAIVTGVLVWAGLWPCDERARRLF
ncbi:MULTISPECIES: DoxX family protein [unclassified Actinoplanes]|uniref:DoxX family protein n=1 Tax=unclassified Actinoplanes TaxID=2626549 RepID=UPI0002FA55F0|nr:MULTISPECIES: DoxX family protein [unclassified Actinoplanes]